MAANNNKGGKWIDKQSLTWKGQIGIEVFYSDITKLKVDAIVTSTNAELGHSAGLAGAIGKAAGPELQKVCNNRISKNGKLKVTDTFTTSGFKLPCKYVIHTMGPQWRSEDNRSVCEQLLYQTLINCLKAAEDNGVKSIAIPAISHGIFGVPLPIVVKQIFVAITDHLKTGTSGLKCISIVDINTEFLSQMQRQFKANASSDDEDDNDDDGGASVFEFLLAASLLHGLAKAAGDTSERDSIDCPYWNLCRKVVNILDIGAYLESHFDMCFCRACIQSRGDDDYYERGNPKETYALPVGWARFGLKTHPKCKDKKLNIFDNWHVAFHGTSAHNVTGILAGGELLMPGDVTMDGKKIEPPPGHFSDKRKPDGFDIQQIFTSPTIKYAGHEAYARPIPWKDDSGKQRIVKIVLQLRIKPGSYKVGKQTTDSSLTSRIDPKFDNAKLEWSTNNRGATVVTGLLVHVQ